MNAATPIVREARLRIPIGDVEHRTYKGNLVAPGFAQRNIRKASKIIDGRAVVSIGVRREAFYATQFVELGTQKMDATPWLVPAFENQRDEVERRLADQLRTKIAKLTMTINTDFFAWLSAQAGFLRSSPTAYTRANCRRALSIRASGSCAMTMADSRILTVRAER